MRWAIRIAALAMLLGVGQANAQEIRVAAASSLADVLPAIGAAFTARTGLKIVPVFAASSALARQIEQGGPFDLFISADQEWMSYLETKNRLVAGTRRNIVGNALVLVAPTAMPAPTKVEEIMDLPRLLGTGRLAVADTDSVPAGRYAKAALQAMGLWEGLRGRLAPAENVRAALAFVARAEAPYGIVYATDAAAEPRVRVIMAFPPSSYPPITYPAALLGGSDRVEPARKFQEFLVGAEAAAIFGKFGFSRPPP